MRSVIGGGFAKRGVIMKKLFLAALCVVCGMTVFGQGTEADSFEIRDNTLVRYTGDGGAVVIPPGVTAIGNDAFYYSDRLTSVSIPSSVTAIGDDAFRGCSSLADIELSRRTRIGYDAFNGVPGSLRYRD
jgi:hypothetical protein